MSKKLVYVRPEEVGVSGRAVARLIEGLDCETTEPHGLMMMRHGKIFAEGYWQPYAKGIVHGMQSLSKTYVGTAVGIALEQGILGLDDRIIDCFPEEADGISQPWLKELKIRHLLSMSTGMRSMSGFQGNWIVNFLKNPIVDEPGTKFFYNSVGSTLLGEIVRRKTGTELNDWLRINLYEKTGMDSDKIKWLCLPDGLEIGGSGLYTTLENNIRLGLLYLRHGEWNGEQIISREFCRLASTKQVDNAAEDGILRDGHAGYGYQMWMGLHHNTYCMCGALGQYTIVCPDEDIVIAFTGRTNEAVQAASETLMGKFWDFLDSGVDQAGPDMLKEQEDDLAKKMAGLSLPAAVCCPTGNRESFEGKWKIVEGELDLDMTTGGIMRQYFQTSAIKNLTVAFSEDELLLTYVNDRGSCVLCAGMDGVLRLNECVTPPFPCKKVVASAAFSEDGLIVHLRWLETCYSARIFLYRQEEHLIIEKKYEDADPAGSVTPYCARAVREE